MKKIVLGSYKFHNIIVIILDKLKWKKMRI